MKEEVRILGIDDGPFEKKNGVAVLVVGTVFRGGHFMDGCLSTTIEKDGDDATEKLIALVTNSKFKPQLQCIMLNGIALGGFNVIDVRKLHEETGIPVMTVIRIMPDLESMKKALSYVKNAEKKWTLLSLSPPIRKMGSVYCQWVGMMEENAREFISLSTTHGKIPEPLRIAHIIARGIVTGESKGRA